MSFGNHFPSSYTVKHVSQPCSARPRHHSADPSGLSGTQLRNSRRNSDKSGVSLPESAKKAAVQQSAHLTQMTKAPLSRPCWGICPRAAQLEELQGGKPSGDYSQTGTDGLSGEQRSHSGVRKQDKRGL